MNALNALPVLAFLHVALMFSSLFFTCSLCFSSCFYQVSHALLFIQKIDVAIFIDPIVQYKVLNILSAAKVELSLYYLDAEETESSRGRLGSDSVHDFWVRALATIC